MLFIIKKDYFLADYILDALEGRQDIKIIRYERLKPHGLRKLPFLVKRFVRAFVSNRKGLWTDEFFGARFLSEARLIKPGDKVLFWGCENLKELLTIDKEIQAAEKSVFLWNPVSTICRNAYSRWEYRHYLHRSGMQVYTFDDGDAARYGFHAVNQVYRKPDGDLRTEDTDTDVYFVGADKHRTAALEKVKAELDRQGISYSINILKDKHTEISEQLRPCYVDRLIPYGETLAMIARSRCVLEILQKGQGGMTLRSLEALMLRRKLITDNRDITAAPFYDPANVYILGADLRSLREFVDSPMAEVDNDVVNAYEITEWIKKFL